jgi:protein dithiol oxidoreductase (disulfide-forming)
MSIFNSFGIRTKVAQANQLMDAYGVDSVPTIIVQGRFATSPSQTRGADRTMAVVDYLVAQVRAGH